MPKQLLRQSLLVLLLAIQLIACSQPTNNNSSQQKELQLKKENTISIASWNIQNFGKSKDDAELAYIATVINDFDVVTIQEVSTNFTGAQRVAALADLLNRKGQKWDYAVSDPTISTEGSSERYAYLWKTAKLKLKGKAFLDTVTSLLIEREPYIAHFTTITGNKAFTLASIHAVPKKKQPEKELKYLLPLANNYKAFPLIIMGDFNLIQAHSVYNPLKKAGFKPVLVNQKTSLKQKCIGTNCLASEYDNLFLPKQQVTVTEAGVVHFYSHFPTQKEALKISDHIPIYAKCLF